MGRFWMPYVINTPQMIPKYSQGQEPLPVSLTCLDHSPARSQWANPIPQTSWASSYLQVFVVVVPTASPDTTLHLVVLPPSAPLGCKFPRLALFLMTVLRSTHLVFCRTSLSFISSDIFLVVFLGLWVRERKIAKEHAILITCCQGKMLST